MLAVNHTSIFYFPEERDFFEYFLQGLPLTVYNRLEDFCADTNVKKIVFLHFPYPYNNEIEKFLNQHLDLNAKFYIVITELHADAGRFISQYDRDNIVYFINGQLNFDLVHSQVYYFLDWFETTKQYYSLDQYTADYCDKPYFFDALLGRNKPHRSMVNNYIRKNLQDQVYLKFNPDPYNFDFANWDPGVDQIYIAPGTSHTVEYAVYNNRSARISQIIPDRIYKQTYYSLVAETHALNEVVFLTEKIVKPIITKRLFILVGNRYSLKFLKSLGFKTFDNVIDESYDLLETAAERASLALEQVRYLCTQDPATVIKNIKSTVEHNHQLMMSADWRKSLSRAVVEFIEQ